MRTRGGFLGGTVTSRASRFTGFPGFQALGQAVNHYFPHDQEQEQLGNVWLISYSNQ